MKRVVLLLLLLFNSACWSADLFVSPEGDDASTGSEQHPFATIAHARDVARQRRSEPVTIRLLPGTHYLDAPVVFGPDDSRSVDAPLIVAGQGGAVVSGGQHLQLDWERYEGGPVWRAKVSKDFDTDQLFAAGARLPMARYPNFDEQAQYFNGSAADCISPERTRHWADPRGGLFHAMHEAHWGDMHYRITGRDGDTITYEGGWQNNRKSKPHLEHRFVENIFEELDAPGEWFLDRQQNFLYLIPPAGMDPPSLMLEAVRLEQLFVLRGSVEAPVQFVHLKDLTLTHTARTFMKNREPLLRSDWTIWRGGAVMMSGVQDCDLQRLTIRQVGSNAIFVSGYARRIHVEGCHITQAGASSVSFVGLPAALRSPLFNYHETQTLEAMDKQPGPLTKDFPSQCVVDDCVLTLNGRFEKQTAGVNICMAAEITVRHCSIYDVPRAGINICDGAFGGHLIEHCDVFDTVKETGDHGSFNSWGRDRFWHPDRSITESWLDQYAGMPTWDAQKTTVLRHNRWRCDLGWDIDLDDGSSNYHIYNNLCLSGGIKLREGYDRLVENNVLVNNAFHPHVWYRNSGSRFLRNIVFAPHAPAGMKPDNYGSEVDFNFLHVDGQADIEKASGLGDVSGADENSIASDAQFQDIENGNYAVREGSPAVEVGFRNFPMSGFGVVSPRLREIAKTPVLPGSAEEVGIVNRGWGQTKVMSPHKKSMKTHWDGAIIKNMQTEGEKSAAGLDDVRGVIVVALKEASPAAQRGLREQDVVLDAGGEVGDVRDLLRLLAERPDAKLTVWRNQAKVVLD